MQQAFAWFETTFLPRVKLRIPNKYHRKEEAMNEKLFNLEFAIKNLQHGENITDFTDSEGGQWLPAYKGCVPAHTHSFKTNAGREWSVKNGWRQRAEKLIMPDDPRNPVNFAEAHFKIPILHLDKLPVQMQKDFHIIRERIEEIRSEEKEAKMFADFVLDALEAQGVTINTKKESSLVSDIALIKNIMREAYGKFKRPK